MFGSCFRTLAVILVSDRWTNERTFTTSPHFFFLLYSGMCIYTQIFQYSVRVYSQIFQSTKEKKKEKKGHHFSSCFYIFQPLKERTNRIPFLFLFLHIPVNWEKDKNNINSLPVYRYSNLWKKKTTRTIFCENDKKDPKKSVYRYSNSLKKN